MTMEPIHQRFSACSAGTQRPIYPLGLSVSGAIYLKKKAALFNGREDLFFLHVQNLVGFSLPAWHEGSSPPWTFLAHLQVSLLQAPPVG